MNAVETTKSRAASFAVQIVEKFSVIRIGRHNSSARKSNELEGGLLVCYEITGSDQQLDVVLTGIISVKEATSIRQQLFPLIQQDFRSLTFHLGTVTQIDSSGLGLLLAVQKIARNCNANVSSRAALQQRGVPLMNRHDRHTEALGDRQTPDNFVLSYARIFHDSQEAIMVTDRHSRIVSVNPAFTSITGYDESEAIGHTPSLLKSHYQDPEFYVNMWASIHKDGKWCGEIWNRRKNGEIYPEWLSIHSVKDENGDLINYVGMFSDVTLRKNTVSKLRLHAQVFSNASEGIMITDKKLQILSVNQAFTTMTGYTEREAAGHTPRLLHSGLQDQYFYIKMWERIHTTGFWEGEIWNRRKNGELYPEWLSITTLRDEEGNITNYIGMFTDITERKQTEEHLKYLAHFDKLTNLPNRALLSELVNEATARCMEANRKLAVFFIDLDRFKMVNDSLGHSVGDKLLQQVAKRLISVVRTDDIVSRLGGDEFIIVLRDLADSEEAILIANQLIASIKKPFSVADNELYLNASIGICMYPRHGEDFETLLKHADLAMYQAKIQNGGYQFFNEVILSTFLRKLDLENELRWAITKNQFTLYYQPQVSSETGEMKGMEALIRWNHPTLGLVSPGEFIPIAEETGIIMDIGKWVLKEVCTQLSRWLSTSYAVPAISINLSARQFLAPDLASSFHDMVRQTCCNPQHIILEITESSSMHDIELVLPILYKLKSYGFQIAIDDFGKGYSALGYMKQFPIDILKIDKSFVQELTSDSKSTVVTKAIIDMSHGMDLRVIAEGVETMEQMECLRRMNCDMVQGYWIARPMPTEQLEARYLKGPNRLAEASIEVDSDPLTTQLKMIDLSLEDMRVVHTIQPLIMEHIDEIIDAFYATIVEVTVLRQIIIEHSTIERLRGTLKEHIIELFSGRIDSEYVQKRLRIAEVHQHIGLEPKWYIGSFQNLQNTFVTIIHRHAHDSQKSLNDVKAVTKLLNFEQQLVIEAYDKKNSEQIERYNKQIREEVKYKIGLVSLELAALTEQTSASTEHLLASSNQVNQSFLHSANMAQSSRLLSMAGSEKIDELERRIASIHERSLHMENSVAQLTHSSEQIKSIVHLVEDISGQSKLLSLNAAIEAARAGQHGVGFAVVAQEMKKLSDGTREAVRQISEFIQQSSLHTQEVIQSIEEVKHDVELGQQESAQTREMFNQILRSLESSSSEINKVESELEALVQGIEEVDGEHLPEAAFHNLNVITDRLDKKQKSAIMKKLDSYPDIKIASDEAQDSWGLWIDSVLNKEMGLEEFISRLPFQHSNNRDNVKAYVEQLLSREEFTICYPLLIKDLRQDKKDRIIRPVITYTCRMANDELQVVSFVMNRASLEIILADAYECPVEDVRMIAIETYKNLCTKIDSIESSQLQLIVELIDDCLRESIPDWKHSSLLDLKNYRGWLMSRRLFVTKENLNEGNESIFRSELERLMSRSTHSPSTLLNRYLFGNKDAVDYSVESIGKEYHVGSYTADYPVNFKQWKIMKSLPDAALLAVNGPPGTGKTTLIKEIIADSIVKKARLLLEVWETPWKPIDIGQIRGYYQSPLAGRNPYSMIITSTNNKAVDNIGIELRDEVPFLNTVLALANSIKLEEGPMLEIADNIVTVAEDEEEEFASRLEDEGLNPTGFISNAPAIHAKEQGVFCARLGNRTNMTEFRNQQLDGVMKGLEHADIEALLNPEIRNNFSASLCILDEIHQQIELFWEQLQLCLEKKYLDNQRDTCTAIAGRKSEIGLLDDNIDRQRLIQERCMLNKQEKEAEIVKLEKGIPQLESELHSGETKLRQMYVDRELFVKWSSFPQTLLNFLPKRRRFLKDNPTLAYIQEVGIEPLNQEILSIKSRIQESNELLPKCKSDLVILQHQLGGMEDELQILISSRDDLQQSLHQLLVLHDRESDLKKSLQTKEPLTATSYYDLANAPFIVQLRQQLFKQALAVNEQYIIKYCAPIAHNLEKVGEEQRWFKSFYSENGKRLDQYQKAIRAIWESFFLCFPVATTTLHSFSEQLFQPLPGLIDTLFVDEAGQIMPHYLCAPLYRSQKAVIVGDPEQLEPVRPFTLNLIEESDVQKELHDRICVLQNSAQEYADRGSEYYEFMGSKKKGIILTEHRRCEANIMRFSNFHVYRDMLVLFKEDESNKLFGANIVAIDIRGVKEKSSHHNYSEIAACKKVVSLLVERYGNEVIQDIGIITPFSSQAKQLAGAIAGVEVGTVHTFQGKEKRFILFSSVIDGVHSKNKGLSFVIGSKPNLLNVAFSRAKEQFIWVGNIETGLASGNYVEKAIRIIQKHGAIYSLYNEKYENLKYSEKRGEAYAVYEDKQNMEGVDFKFINYMNELLHDNVLLNPRRHHELMLKAMEYCRSSLGIVSPWVNSNVMDEKFFTLLGRAMDRKVDFKVRFGYNSSKLTLQEIDKIVDRDNYSFKNKEVIKIALKELHDRLDSNLVYMPPLHTKVLLIDDRILFIGSHNWLSNHGKLSREEISYMITNSQTIEYVKKRFEL
ncbi:hypothetical protein AXX17_ATUG04230 [Arabidopsis thaliana]|uniref:Diguanylate cyclase DosC n=1 Tax=Arabidopsis thaliana TaxID=3702 RepID=A0A178U7N9_ARATH|nr:hypothetical protein AXX17_ATUG04230 [Arabidopsis thaliana]